MEILRNMWRRKFRTTLTIIGIVIGIFAFTVMGSMALKLNKMIAGGKNYITGQISISPRGTDFMSGTSSLLPVDTLAEIAKVEGVQAVEGSVSLTLDAPDPDSVSMSFGQPATINSLDPTSGFENRNWKKMAMKSGKMIDKDSAVNDITIGITVSLDKSWKLGDSVDIRSQKFNVVGILEKTMTGPDSYVFMNLSKARELYVESNPFLKSLKEQSESAGKISDSELAKLSPEARAQIVQAKSFKMEDVSTSASVSWKDGVDADKLSETLKNDFKKEISVMSPKAMGELIDKASATMNAVIYGAALLALVVGLFSIVNTMVMSISERTKEIGIKKALGASNRSISFEYTLEAGFIGVVGGLIGAALGGMTAYLLNQKMASQGAEIFLLEPSFFIGVIVFSFVIGIVAGLVPAARAAKMKVVDAVREL